MNNNMYLYFDSNGYLKEFITCPARAGSENINSIYFYVEPALESDRNKVDGNGDAYFALPNNLDHGVLTFKLHDVLDGITDENGVVLNSLAFTNANFRIEDIQPFDKKRDLLFFKWFQKYQFVKVDLTADILLNAGNVECTIGCYNVSNIKVYNLDLFSFYVADSAVQSANYVTTSQYHMLLALMQSGLSSAVMRYNVSSGDTLADIYDLIGTQIVVLNVEGDEYLCEMSGNTNIVIYDIHNREWYAFTGANSTVIDDVINNQYKITYVQHRSQSGNNAYVSVGGTDTLMKVSSNAEGGIMSRNSSGQTKVGDPTDDEHAANKGYVDNKVADLGNLFTYKGDATVVEINALTNIGNGWAYNLNDSGTLTLGNLQVETGDNVAFNGTIWTKLSSETVLGQYYTKQEGQEFEQDVNEQISAIGNQVQQVASGSPKGAYATLNDLETAYPTGAEGIYVVSGTGHWYYWNGSAWADGGVYLSTVNAVPETRTIAGVSLANNITDVQLALGLREVITANDFLDGGYYGLSSNQVVLTPSSNWKCYEIDLNDIRFSKYKNSVVRVKCACLSPEMGSAAYCIVLYNDGNYTNFYNETGGEYVSIWLSNNAAKLYVSSRKEDLYYDNVLVLKGDPNPKIEFVLNERTNVEKPKKISFDKATCYLGVYTYAGDTVYNNITFASSSSTRLSMDIQGFLDKNNPLLSIGGYFYLNDPNGTYSVAVGSNSSGSIVTFEDNGIQWIKDENGNAWRKDKIYLKKYSEVFYAKMALFKRNDDANISSEDIEYIKNNFYYISPAHNFVSQKIIGKNYEETGKNKIMHISFDDVERCIQNLITNKNTFTSIFDDNFLAFLKSLHEEFGACFSLYVYGSTFANLDDTYYQDFYDNRDWLKFGLHLGSGRTNYNDVSYANAKSDYEAFVNKAIQIGLTIEGIDRIPRLQNFSLCEASLEGMMDCSGGIIGMLTPDDNRDVACLTTKQKNYLIAHDKMLLEEYNFWLYSTDMRLDWFITGFSSEYTYLTPVKSDPYYELEYRYGSKVIDDKYDTLVVFIHEWQMYSSDYLLNSNKNLVTKACEFVWQNGYSFSYPMYNCNNKTDYSQEKKYNTAKEIVLSYTNIAVGDTGTITPNNARLATDKVYFKYGSKIKVNIQSGWQARIWQCDTPVSDTNGETFVDWTSSSFDFDANHKYYRFCVRKADQSDLSSADGVSIKIID